MSVKTSVKTSVKMSVTTSVRTGAQNYSTGMHTMHQECRRCMYLQAQKATQPRRFGTPSKQMTQCRVNIGWQAKQASQMRKQRHTHTHIYIHTHTVRLALPYRQAKLTSVDTSVSASIGEPVIAPGRACPSRPPVLHPSCAILTGLPIPTLSALKLSLHVHLSHSNKV